MRYEKITRAIFMDRPNRFIAHVNLPEMAAPASGTIQMSQSPGLEPAAPTPRNQPAAPAQCLTVHVKNTGRCRELLIPGVQVILEESDTPKRKTRYDLVSVYKEKLGWVNIDSQAANKLAHEWLLKQGYDYIKPEYTYGNSRIDFYMEKNGEKYLMEVKGCTLEMDGIGYFPDAPTERGIKHLHELMKAKEAGYRAIAAFVIQMNGIKEVRPNRITHPAFADAWEEAREAGVEIRFLCCEIGEQEVRVIEEHCL